MNQKQRVMMHLEQLISISPEGSVLPSQSQIMEQTGIRGVRTITDAVAELQARGLVERTKPDRRWRVKRVDGVKYPDGHVHPAVSASILAMRRQRQTLSEALNLLDIEIGKLESMMWDQGA